MDDDLTIRVAALRSCSEAEGPGRRAVVWVQGCSLRCPSCCNPSFQTTDSGTLVSVYALAHAIVSAKALYGLEEVTFLGGEPMEQAHPLSIIASICQQNALTVWTFTGYTLQQLQARHDTHINSLLKFSDVLVDGPFQRQHQEHTRAWAGSTNQTFHYLSKAYVPGLEYQSITVLELSNGPGPQVQINGDAELARLLFTSHA